MMIDQQKFQKMILEEGYKAVADKMAQLPEEERKEWELQSLLILDYLWQQNASYRAERFKSPYEQLTLEQFELCSEEDISHFPKEDEEEAPAPKKKRTRRAKADRIGTSDLPVETIIKEPESTYCPDCGSELVQMGYKVSRKLRMIPARLYIVNANRTIYTLYKAFETVL